MTTTALGVAKGEIRTFATYIVPVEDLPTVLADLSDRGVFVRETLPYQYDEPQYRSAYRLDQVLLVTERVNDDPEDREYADAR